MLLFVLRDDVIVLYLFGELMVYCLVFVFDDIVLIIINIVNYLINCICIKYLFFDYFKGDDDVVDMLFS